jgi:hypothetical protein
MRTSVSISEYLAALVASTSLLVGFALTAPPARAAAEEEANKLEVRVGETVEISTSHRYCWYPTVHQFPTGEIMVTMRMSPDEINPEGDFSAYCISQDGGRTWSPRHTMGSGANVDGAWSAFPHPDGSIWQLWGWVESYPEGQARQFYMTLTKFRRGGREFTQVRDVPLGFNQPADFANAELSDRRVVDAKLEKQPGVMPWGPILEGLNGDLIASVYFSAASDPKYPRLVLIRSRDGGKTWDEYSTMAALAPGETPWPWMGKEGPCEAGMVRLADNRLYTIFRTGVEGFLGQAWSADDGKTWTHPTPVSYRGVAPRVRRLSNGALACVTGRPGPVVVMFSVDGTGEKWSNITEVFAGKATTRHQASETTSHYADLIELEPGKLLVVYDSIPYAWAPIPLSDKESKNSIFGTIVYVRKK